MIAKDEVQNAIKEYLKSKFDEKVDVWGVLEINADIQRIIDELDNNPWNPVDESVPTDSRFILLSFENFTIPVIGRYEEDENGGAFYIGDEDETTTQQDLFVNAWMELPKRYERLVE